VREVSEVARISTSLSYRRPDGPDASGRGRRGEEEEEEEETSPTRRENRRAVRPIPLRRGNAKGETKQTVKTRRNLAGKRNKPA